jgi:hypothetical protein
MNLIETALKAAGIKISPETVRQLEVLIPQLPARANEVIEYVRRWQADFEARLTAIEETQRKILELLKHDTE